MASNGNGFPQFGNMYAPPWMGFSPILPGIRDIETDVDLPQVTVSQGSFARSNELFIDNDADFLCREIQFLVSAFGVTAPAPSDIRVRIRDGDGRMFTSDFVPILDLCGPLVPPWPLQRGSVLIVDYQNVSTAVNSTATVWMVLKLWRRMTCADQRSLVQPYTPMYSKFTQPSKDYDLDDFEYPFVFTVTGAVDRLKIPLQTDNDADFLWRGITGDWNTANNDVAATGLIGLTPYDVDGLPMTQAPVSVPWGSPISGPLREIILASGGGRPAPFYPEIFIPRGGVVSADMSFGAAATLRFSLRGVKVYSNTCPV